jgi:hypothetical protein
MAAPSASAENFGGKDPPGARMAHEIAKLILEHAGSFLDRAEAVETALGLGMPLDEIERYLDWLDTSKPQAGRLPKSDDPRRCAKT